jgi:hypothetical protein
MGELAKIFSSAGPTGFVIVLLAFISMTLLTSLIALVKWVLENTVSLSVHKAVAGEMCTMLGDIQSDTRILVRDNEGRAK